MTIINTKYNHSDKTIKVIVNEQHRAVFSLDANLSGIENHDRCFKLAAGECGIWIDASQRYHRIPIFGGYCYVNTTDATRVTL